MANALVDLIKAGDRDALNAYLLNQQIGGDSSGVSFNGQPNNALAGIVRGQMAQPQMQPQFQPQSQQPINTIINERTGRYITPQGEQSDQPAQFQSKSMQQPRGQVVDVLGQGKGYMQPDGTIVGVNAQGQQFKVQQAGTASAAQSARDAEMKRQAMRQQLEAGGLEIQQKQRELAGGGAVKPTFSAEMGGYIYPPSQDNPQGRFVLVEGAKKPAKPLTEFQGKAALFGSRAAAASDLLDTLGTEESGGAKTLQYWQDVPLAGRVANVMASPTAQKVAQAQRDFVNAVLRLESGATISPSEFQNASQQYFPQPGDDPQVIEQKRLNREMAISGLGELAGESGGEYISKQRAAAKPAASTGYEQTATNPRTGEKIGLRNGKWEPIR